MRHEGVPRYEAGDLRTVGQVRPGHDRPCRQMAPAFGAAARQLEKWIRLLKPETEAEQAIAARFAIRSIPTMILFRDDHAIARQAGAMREAAIMARTRSVASGG